MQEFNSEEYTNSRQTAVSPHGMYGYGTGMPKPTPMPFPQQPMLPTQQAFGFPGQPFAPTPVFPPQAAGAMIPGTMAAPTAPTIPGMLPLEQSYIENILRLNRGKVGTFYFTYENNNQWNAKVYRGVIEAAGRDHIILSDPQTGARYLLLMVNFDYATFDSELNYEYPFGGGTYGGVSPVPTTATPR